MQTFSLFHIFLTAVFTTGLVLLFWALHQEAKEGAPFYVKLSTFSAALLIFATFLAALFNK